MRTLNHLINLIIKSFPPIHSAGYGFIAISCVVTLILLAMSTFLGMLALIITAWMVYFFRNPVRIVPDNFGLVVSPADGVVNLITNNIEAPEELGLKDKKFTRVSIFLNVFDVHVNRIPIGGKITKLNYRPGKFLSADLDKASSDNERQSVVVETEDGKEIVFVQIAGLIARRILCDLHDGQLVQTGDQYGIIRFGSRVDVYLPEGINPQVMIGSRVLGGQSIIADLVNNPSQPTGTAK